MSLCAWVCVCVRVCVANSFKTWMLHIHVQPSRRPIPQALWVTRTVPWCDTGVGTTRHEQFSHICFFKHTSACTHKESLKNKSLNECIQWIFENSQLIKSHFNAIHKCRQPTELEIDSALWEQEIQKGYLFILLISWVVGAYCNRRIRVLYINLLSRCFCVYSVKYTNFTNKHIYK